MGEHLISPFTRALENGWFACSVSIRTGRDGHDRLLRLTRLFRDAAGAAEHARSEGLQWIGVSRASAMAMT